MPLLCRFTTKDWEVFRRGDPSRPGYQRVETCLKGGTLLANELITEHDHITLLGSSWRNQNQPPQESVGVSGPGAWRCRQKHTPGDVWMASNKPACKICGQKREKVAVRNENGDIARANWDLHYDSNHPQQDTGYVLFVRNTGFVSKLKKASTNRHYKAIFPRVRAFLFALLPGITEEEARWYYARCIKWTEGEKVQKIKTQACLDIIAHRAESDGSGT